MEEGFNHGVLLPVQNNNVSLKAAEEFMHACKRKKQN
jgi:hypothetical protein